ncbi:cytochrome P450 [Punctularia strigosozonata HHB-11173 SS5]|uniref:cytochrome P450 n=1 Tax=Punctularia strigosozonata (strain HHB-11173) TaxID=741275 RepID=UPI0004416A43|nr:cytochrome P450 [Punctularia strigosozonata HHB-11173 SS5]EIN06320.1 cytochrome P450 [Punctularia strigosozonata HHB-11173 SS5]
MELPLLAGIALCALGYLIVRLSQTSRRRKGLPPGPPTLPLLGNLHLYSPRLTYLLYTDWAKKYGDVFSLILGPVLVVVLSSADAVREIMDRRSALTADRPACHFDDIMHDGKYLTMARYSDDWRALRKAANSVLTPQSALKHVAIQRAESIQCMYDLLKTPKRLWWHLRRTSNSSIFCVLYGKRAPTSDSADLNAAFHAVEGVIELITPGNFAPVDMFPILRYVPERWARWKTRCRETENAERHVHSRMLQECRERVAKGRNANIEPFMDVVVKRQQELQLTDEMVMWLGVVLMDGGSHTTPAFMQSFVMLLTAYPDVQRKLHEEIDAVVGGDRIPHLDDFDHLPYLQATIKETHRYRPVFPTCISHAASQELTYGGYFIPKGSMITVNLWGIYHDPDVFDDPESFIPDRFLESEFGVRPGVDGSVFKHTMPFGFGRRICPGRHVAEHALRIQTMDLIWGFDFTSEKCVDIDFDAYEPNVMMTPKPFELDVKVRSRTHEKIIQDEFQEAIPSFEPYEELLSMEEKQWLEAHRHTG